MVFGHAPVAVAPPVDAAPVALTPVPRFISSSHVMPPDATVASPVPQSVVAASCEKTTPLTAAAAIAVEVAVPDLASLNSHSL